MRAQSETNLNMGQIIPDQSVLSALEIEKLSFSNLFSIYLLCKPVLLSTQVSDKGPSWLSRPRVGLDTNLNE